MTAQPADAPRNPEPPAAATIVSGAWLEAQVFPPLRYVIDGIIAAGLTILVGGPKLGKSWLVLGLGLAVAGGNRALGAIGTTRSPVLMLALEDGYRRLQGRARYLLGEWVEIPPGLDIVIKGTYLELMAALGDWLNQHQDEHPVVIIDTLGRFRPPRGSSSDAFSADYHFIAKLKSIIDEIEGGALILVHHTKKPTGAGDGDFVESVSGTQALSAAADSTIVLSRRRHEDGAVLSVTGRDIREAEYALVSDQGRWTLDGGSLQAAEDAAREARTASTTSDTTQAIVELVNDRARRGEHTKASDVAEALGVDDHTARTYLARAANRGQIHKANRGTYTCVATVASVANQADLAGIRNTHNTRNTVGRWLGSGEEVLGPDGDAA